MISLLFYDNFRPDPVPLSYSNFYFMFTNINNPSNIYRYCKSRPCADPLSYANFDYIFTNINKHHDICRFCKSRPCADPLSYLNFDFIFTGHSAVFSQLLRWNFMVSPQHTRVALTCMPNSSAGLAIYWLMRLL